MKKALTAIFATLCVPILLHASPPAPYDASIEILELFPSARSLPYMESFADKDIDWKSSDPAIAIVDSIGTVTALTPGEAWLTASSGGKILRQYRVAVLQLPAFTGDVSTVTGPRGGLGYQDGKGKNAWSV